MTFWAQSNIQWNGLDGRPAMTTVAFFLNGTTSPVTVYKDQYFANPHELVVRSDAGGRVPPIYMKPDGKLLRADVTTHPWKTRSIDGIDPGLVTDTPDSDGAAPLLPSISKVGASVSVTAADFGGFLEVQTATGGVVPVQLPAPKDVVNGRIIGIRNNGLGYVPLRPAGIALVDGAKALPLGPNESIVIRSTGATYETFSRTPPQGIKWAAKNRTTKTPPTGANVGEYYLAPDDAGGGWTPSRIYSANGGGGWVAITPVVGDRVSVLDETVTAGAGETLISMPLVLTWTGTKWVSESAYALLAASDAVDVAAQPIKDRITALETAATVALQTIRVTCEAASAVNSLTAQGGVSPVADSWTRNPLTTLTGSITNATLADNLLRLPTGKYRIRATRKAKGAIKAVLGWRSTSTGLFLRGMPITAGTDANVVITLDNAFDVTGVSDQFELVFLLNGTVGALSLGDASAIPSVPEVYAEVVIETRNT